MKFKDHAALNMQTNRLQASSSAAVACEQSLKDPEQIFDYAGQRFTGHDAALMKHALMTALVGIADDATAALKKGGIDFGDIDTAKTQVPADNRRKSRKKGR